ncbi:HAMP domain-containing histidine kinase [Patescibacteria group bacterium]|nr:MAG: HAMP domain-containing histidine kinase [Patescibacteria group bacterium]
MFRSAIVKLTAAYLGILMIISLGFSAAVYQVSYNALDESLRLQIEAIQHQPRFRYLPPTADFLQIHDEQLEQGRDRIAFKLLLVNLIVLVVGGVGSYWLAGRTLRPIEDALESQTRFAADASHELRTPLTAMRTEIEVALRDKSLRVADAKNLLESNLEEIDKLRSLANSLLTLSRYQAGGRVVFTQTDTKTVLDIAVKRVEAITKETGAVIKVVGDKVSLRGEQESLVALVVILLENAMKYRQAKPKIEVAVRRVGRRAEIEVKDNGIGIKEQDLPKIFDRFYRADASRSKSVEGYGLGLSIAKQIAAMHHGTITASSKTGKGTTMVVALPLNQPKQSLPV